MITSYHRPKTLEEVLKLLGEQAINPRVLIGGAFQGKIEDENVSFIDLQALGLEGITRSDRYFQVGGMATLQMVADFEGINPALRKAIHLEVGRNVRNSMTMAGHLTFCDGRSPLTTALLALDTTLIWQPNKVHITLGDYLPVRHTQTPGFFVSGMIWSTNVRLAYETIARTPVDRPIVSAALAQWPSGRTRLALGGYGDAPIIAFDGPEPGGVELAAGDAFSDAEDEWASALYRQEMAGVLTLRCLNQVKAAAMLDGEEL